VLYKQVQHFTAGEEKISMELKSATEIQARLQVYMHHLYKELCNYRMCMVYCGCIFAQMEATTVVWGTHHIYTILV